MDKGLLAAIAHYPDRGRAIQEFAGRDDEFCSLCGDLADAEAALKGWERSTSQVREERCTEYRELIGELAAEIGAMLDRQAGPLGAPR
jgi:hypothetical protein